MRHRCSLEHRALGELSRRSQLFHICALTTSIVPETEQGLDALDGEAEVSGALDETKYLNVLLCVLAIPRRCSVSFGNKTDTFVVSDHFRVHARNLSSLSNVHIFLSVFSDGFQRRKSSEFDTTLTLLRAIAAPATIGLRYPSAANGMPTTL